MMALAEVLFQFLFICGGDSGVGMSGNTTNKQKLNFFISIFYFNFCLFVVVIVVLV